jgi:hypothetical protein
MYNARPSSARASCQRPRRSFSISRLGSSRRLLLKLGVTVLLLGVCKPAAAQERSGVVQGRVTGSGGAPLGNAQVVIVDAGLSTLSDAAGRFRLSGIPSGAQVLEIHFVGYQTGVHQVEIVGSEAVIVQVTMELQPVELEEVGVRGRAALPGHLQGFYDRRERGAGHFFTHEEIVRMQARAFTDVLRRVPGVDVRPASGRYGTAQSIQMGRATGIAGSRECPVLYFLNGQRFPVAPELGINHFVRPDEIAAVEVYAGSSRLPPQFHGSRHNARCGVVVIWTRTGPVRGSSAQ